MTRLRGLLLPIFSLLLLAGCLPAFQQGAPTLHDVALYTPAAGTIYGYFYGEPADLSVSGETVELTRGPSDDPLSVPSALLIDDAPYLEETVAPLGNAPVVVQRVPYSTDLLVSAEQDVLGILYYDGEAWFTVAGELQAGYSSRVVPRGRIEGLFGLGELTRAEAEVFQRNLEARGPVVVTALAQPRDRTRQANGLGGYLSTALVVQRGLTTVAVTPIPTNPETNPDWEVLASGTQATGGESPSFELVTSEAGLKTIWGRAHGSLLEPPPLPEVDFGSSSVAAVFLGTRSTGGYSVEVQNVALQDGELYLDVATSEPAPGSVTTQALTNPWVMVRIDTPSLGAAWFRDVSTGELLGTARGIGEK